jgi:hypothetical protein
LVESAITTGSFILGDKLVYSQPIEMKKALLSFGSSYLTDMGVSYVQPMLTKMTPSLAEERYAKSLVSGALYVLGDKVFHYDNRGMLIPFLMQVGSQAVSSYMAGPVEKWF